jgi:hypothetical protein
MKSFGQQYYEEIAYINFEANQTMRQVFDQKKNGLPTFPYMEFTR